MGDSFIIGVPVEDRDDLTSLAEELQAKGDLGEHRYFDGATFVEVVLPLVLSGGSWLTIRTWLRTRADKQKAMRVTCRGTEITGMKPRDAERMIRVLAEAGGFDAVELEKGSS
jgi:hypothetical protein